MGSQQTKTEEWVNEIPVPATKPAYPQPEPPKFFLPDLLKNYKIRDHSENKDGNMNWKQVKEIANRSLDEQAAIETGKIISDGSIVNGQNNKLDESQIEGNEKAEGVEDGIREIRLAPDTNDKETANETGSNLQEGSEEVGQQHNKQKKISFGEIDQHARDADPQHAESFQSLFSYLAQKVLDSHYPDVCFVRGITAWFCDQDVASLKPVTATLASPAGLVQHIRNKSLTLTSAYTLLMRAANIPCVIIHGIEKGGHYKPGDPVHDMIEGHWCAVYVDRSWQLIHPLWACRGTYEAMKEKDNKILIEEDVQKEKDFNDTLLSQQKQNARTVKYLIQDDYFMPKPEFFKHRCHAFDRKWQLLPRQTDQNVNDNPKAVESILNTKVQFKLLPYMSPAFFKLNLQLVSSPYSCLQTSGDIIKIQLEMIPELSRKLLFRHKLTAIEIEQADDHRIRDENISLFVFYHRCNDRAVFEIALPCRGTYLFEISGGIHNTFYNLSRFHLTCTENRDVSLLPLNAGIDGWGPGPKSQSAGLLVPSKPKGIITYQSVKEEKTKLIQPRIISIIFDVSREFVENTEYTVEIIGKPRQPNESSRQLKESRNSSPQTDNSNHALAPEISQHGMKDWVSVSKDRLTKKLEIQVEIKEDGDYALVIRSTELEDRPLNMKAKKQGTTKDVCYYLLRPYDDYTRQGPKMKFAKNELVRALQSENHTEMSTAVDRCLLLGFEVTNEDIAACKVKMEYIKLKTDITDCIKRRNLSVLNDTLLRVLKYRYRAALVDEVEELLDFRKKILAIDGYQLYLPTIREAIDELYKMPHVPPEVHNTVAAALVMLHHPVEKLDWQYIKSQLRVTGDRSGNLAKQIDKYESSQGPPDMHDIRLAEQVLYRCTFPQVLHVNHSAATFYKWVEAITIRLREFERAQRDYAEKMATRQAEIEQRQAERRQRKQAKKHKHRHLSF